MKKKEGIKMCIATMKTMTSALRGVRLLRSAGIEGEVVSLDRTLTKNGCAYGISFPCYAVREVKAVLYGAQVSYGQIIGEGS